MSERMRRVGALLHQEIASLLTRGLRQDLPAFTTVTDVRVAPDLRTAKVAVSVFGSDEEREAVLEVLAEEAKWIRKHVGDVVRLKYIPELSFELDTTLDNADRLEELFDEIHAQEAAAEDA